MSCAPARILVQDAELRCPSVASVPPTAKHDPEGGTGKRHDDPDNGPKATIVLAHRDAADVHAEQAGDDVDRQCEYRKDGEQEQAAVVLLIDLARDLFLQQLDPL